MNNKREPVEVMFKEAIRDMMYVTDLGGKKHGYGSWLDPDNPSLQRKNNYGSMCRHAAEYYMEVDLDPESGQDPLLHLAWRAMAAYCRKKRGIE